MRIRIVKAKTEYITHDTMAQGFHQALFTLALICSLAVNVAGELMSASAKIVLSRHVHFSTAYNNNKGPSHLELLIDYFIRCTSLLEP